ncbi:MAG: hypothetical protein IPO60_08160 [Flavobacteriales bacterium]|nr:hypothetical protein [Flavobacteriales bacterium]
MGGADSAMLSGAGEDVTKDLADVLFAGVDLQFTDAHRPWCFGCCAKRNGSA